MRKLFSLRSLAGLAAIATTVSLVACDAAGSNRSSSPVTSGTTSPSEVASGVVSPEVSPSSSTTYPAPLSPSPTSSVASTAQPKGQPGVPDTPVAEHETWPAVEGQNMDRQLDYKGSGVPSVTLPAAVGDDLSAYAQQTITWEACGEGVECATMKVPLDWENPGKASLDIALTRKPSANPSKGPLFFNPGGPGVSARPTIQGLPVDAVPGYDLVGWDPRGAGESTHVECGTTEQTNAAFLADNTPDDETEEQAKQEGWKAFARQCRDASGELLDHVSTIENVRDLDLLRHLLGAEKLNYLGWSYGTFVGATYAELFPERSGHLVLDSAVDISVPSPTLLGVGGFEKALQHFADWCAREASCSLGEDRDAVLTRIDAFLKNLDANPVVMGEWKLTQSVATLGLGAALYGAESTYPRVATALQHAMDGDGAELIAYFGIMVGHDGKGWTTRTYAFPAIACVDRPDRGMGAADKQVSDKAVEAPVFAANLGVLPMCEYWTADSAPNLTLTAKGAGPILVIGATVDPVTPHDNSVAMAKQLDSATLLTWEGSGHAVAFTGKSTCIDEAVVRYLTTGEVPADGTSCPA